MRKRRKERTAGYQYGSFRKGEKRRISREKERKENEKKDKRAISERIPPLSGKGKKKKKEGREEKGKIEEKGEEDSPCYATGERRKIARGGEEKGASLIEGGGKRMGRRRGKEKKGGPLRSFLSTLAKRGGEGKGRRGKEGKKTVSESLLLGERKKDNGEEGVLLHDD